MPELYGKIIERSASRSASTSATPSLNARGEFRWQPPVSIHCLPADFAIEMTWQLDTAGYRRFLPAGGSELFLAQAHMAGAAILSDVRNLNDQERQAYRLSWFLYQLGTRMREHVTRRFHSKQDLIIRRKGRGGGPSSTLPDSVEVNELVGRGHEIGRLAGQDFSDRMAIRHALTEFAEQNPLKLAENEISPLIRASLFDWSSPEDPDIRAFVEERFLRLFNGHLSDSHHQFDRWFFPGHGNIVKAIADQKKSQGGKLKHIEVRNALLAMSWKSFFDVASCIHATARYIENAWGEQLSDRERMIFEAMYLPQPHFGGLSLLMLTARIGMVSVAVEKIIQAPADKSLLPVLYRLLQLYTDMVAARRDADRRSKRYGMSEATEFNPDQILSAMAAELAKKHELSCSKCNTWLIELPKDFLAETSFELKLTCDCRRQEKKFTATLSDLQAIGARLAKCLPI